MPTKKASLNLNTNRSVCQYAYQEGLIEFEVTGELPHELVHTVQPLQEHWAALVAVL